MSKLLYKMLFETHALVSIMEHQHTFIELSSRKPLIRSIAERIKNPKNLTVRIDIPEPEFQMIFQKALRESELEYARAEENVYKTYLRQLFNGAENIPFEKIKEKIDKLRDIVISRLTSGAYKDEMLVRSLLQENKYISKNCRRTGLVVKLFRAFYDGRDVIVKTYLYDPCFESLSQTVEPNFENEATFQLYAEYLAGKLDFISPELYSWGQIRHHALTDGGYKFKCLFLIMEYIPGLTLKEASYTAENMKQIYEKVDRINTDMMGNLLHHNDLHGGNIIVRTSSRSPEPEIIIFDFGEASLGPTKPIYHR